MCKLPTRSRRPRGASAAWSFRRRRCAALRSPGKVWCRRRRRPNRRSSANQSRLLHHTIGWPSARTSSTAMGCGGVTKSGGAGFTDVTTKTGYEATVHRQDLTKITLTAEEAALCDRFRLQPHEWLQAQMDGAICAVYEGREFGNCFATKTGRPQRMFTVESNGDVRCALCDWTAPERASTAMQNDLSTWKRLFPSLKTHCGQTPSSLSKPAVKRHVERVLAMAAEPSKPPTATIDTDDGETPEPRRPSKRPRGAPPVHAAAARAEPPQLRRTRSSRRRRRKAARGRSRRRRRRHLLRLRVTTGSSSAHRCRPSRVLLLRARAATRCAVS